MLTAEEAMELRTAVDFSCGPGKLWTQAICDWRRKMFAVIERETEPTPTQHPCGTRHGA